jgi:glycerophosphoryl diester phosphodiesterase
MLTTMISHAPIRVCHALAVVLLASACAARIAATRVPDAALGGDRAAVNANVRPLIIGHRGASGLRPEHTLASYDLAITLGADYIEPDLVMTRDHALVARHENEIGGTTDVAERFPDRQRTQVIDGVTVTGWFAEDFTLAELKSLRARERIATRSHLYDGQFSVPTFDEVLDLVRRREREIGRTIGVYPETKHPSHLRAIGLPMEDSLLAVLARHGFRGASDAVFIQSFEVGNLRALHARTTIRLVQLLDIEGAPPDLAAAGDTRGARDFVTPASLREFATYAFAIGAHKALVLPPRAPGASPEPTSLVRDAHAAGLAVHVWTMRSDAPFLGAEYRGNAAAEWQAFASLGVDGIFGDFPDVGVGALVPGQRIDVRQDQALRAKRDVGAHRRRRRTLPRVASGRQDRERRPPRASTLDVAAAEHPGAVVEHERLPGRDRRHRLVERQLDLSVLEAHDFGRRRARAMAHLHLHPRAHVRRVDEPVHLPRHHAEPEQCRARPDHHLAPLRPDRHYEHRLGEAAREPAPLPDGEARVTVVLPDHPPVGEDHGAARERRGIVP